MDDWKFTIEKVENGYVIAQTNSDTGRVETYVYNTWKEATDFLSGVFLEG